MLNITDAEMVVPWYWLDTGWGRSWPTLFCAYMAFLTGAYRLWPLRDRIWCPGALVSRFCQASQTFFIYLNIHPDMPAITCNENALLYWRGVKRGVGKKGTWKERDLERKRQRKQKEITCPSTETTQEQNYCGPACWAKGVQLLNEN